MTVFAAVMSSRRALGSARVGWSVRASAAVGLFCAAGLAHAMLPFSPASPLAPSYPSYGPYSSGGVGGAAGAGGGWWGAWGGVDSPTDAYANLVRSRGQKNLDDSAALLNLEQGRRDQIQNNLDYTKTFFEMRRINSQYKKEQDQASHSSPAGQAEIARKMLPRRMTPSQLDPVTGKIHWPEILMDPRFAGPREALDQLFAHRSASAGGIGSDRFEDVQAACKAMIAELKKNIRQLDTNTFLYCLDFIKSLALEAGYPPQ